MIPAIQIDSKPGFSPAWTHAGYACLVLLAIPSFRAVYEETFLCGPTVLRWLGSRVPLDSLSFDGRPDRHARWINLMVHLDRTFAEGVVSSLAPGHAPAGSYSESNCSFSFPTRYGKNWSSDCRPRSARLRVSCRSRRKRRSAVREVFGGAFSQGQHQYQGSFDATFRCRD